MPFTALLDGQRVWAFDYDAAAWDALRAVQRDGLAALSLECCREPAVLAERGTTLFFRHAAGSECASVQASGVQWDLLGGGEEPDADEIAAAVRWAAAKAGWDEPTLPGAPLPRVIACTSDARAARIVLLNQRFDPENKRLKPLVADARDGATMLWLVTRNVPVPDGVPAAAVVRLPCERPVATREVRDAVLEAVGAFLAAAPAPARLPALAPVLSGDVLPPSGWAAPDGDGVVADGVPYLAVGPVIRPEEHQYSYLHLPGGRTILTLKEREALWGVPVTTPHPEADQGVYSNSPYFEDVTPEAPRRRARR